MNWDYIVYKFLEEGLANQGGINFNCPRSPFDVAIIKNNKFLICHGDQIRSYMGIPYYGMVRAESKLRSMIEKIKNIDGLWEEMEKEGVDTNDPKAMLKFALLYAKSFDYMVMGHFHQMGEMETNSGGRIILNSSFAGGDDYSINSLLSASTAAQKFFGVHVEGKSWGYDIELDR